MFDAWEMLDSKSVKPPNTSEYIWERNQEQPQPGRNTGTQRNPWFTTDMVRRNLRNAESKAQSPEPVQARIRGSGRPLPPVSHRCKPKEDGNVHGIAPIFFKYIEKTRFLEWKTCRVAGFQKFRGFVNSSKLSSSDGVPKVNTDLCWLLAKKI